MKIKHLFFTLSVFITLLSCEKKKDKANHHGEIIKVLLDEANFENVKNISKYINHTELIKLEEHVAESIFGMANKITVKNNLLYIMDSNYKKLLVFDLQGKFVRKIGTRGNGPGEYQNLTDFHVDSIGNTIILDGNREKLYWYDSSGKFLKDKKYPFEADTFTILENDQYLFGLASYNRYKYEGNQIITTTKSFDKVDAFFEYSKYVDDNFSFDYYFVEGDKSILYNRPIDNNVHQLSKTGKLEKTYTFDFGNLNYPDEAKKNIEKNLNEKYCHLFSVPLISHGLMFGNLKFGKLFFSFIYDIKTKEIYLNNFENYAIKDVNFPIGITDDSKIISYTNSGLFSLIAAEININFPDEYKEYLDAGGHIICITELIGSK
ncbi:6-bladed beta-propeller [Flavivirga jejuensis]|uniref:6-bladed beta-propeller n=1 Tax=Flavivirga jejuensis TaxID=870487 RepID=A0ABT8WRZ1_9FLAO|nr:6-bladed beta-propeller [Flavivirga jejuensis]MDO5975935.1 6-bladed beta-propeller [Flavivirga jejuensis]